jgi:hypothetical protein
MAVQKSDWLARSISQANMEHAAGLRLLRREDSCDGDGPSGGAAWAALRIHRYPYMPTPSTSSNPYS